MKFLDFILYEARYAAAIVGLSSLVLLATLFTLSGTLQTDILPELYTSFEQLLGTLLLLTLVPTFLLVFLIAGQRRSMRYAQELFDNRISDHEPDSWLRTMKSSIPLLGAALGLAYALAFNTPVFWLAHFIEAGPQIKSLVLGQAFLWIIVGVVLSFRLHTALCFNKLGRSVRLDLLDIQQVAPFAKNGVDDVLAIALLLVISATQSIDAQFRFANYGSAMLIAIPAATFLFLLPMISIHRRLVQARSEYLTELNGKIASAPRGWEPETIRQLEFLMQHRDRIRDTLTWPLDWSIYSRLAFYVILPPIAWLGAAFVEFGVDRILGTP